MNNIVCIALLATCTVAARLDSAYLQPRGGTGNGGGLGGLPSAPPGPIIPIISYENNPNQGDGTYSYSYESANGIRAEESGRQSSFPGPEGPGTAAHGSYSYIGDDGQTYSIVYTADENGFQPQGDHLPTPPPLPAELVRALQEHANIVASNGGGNGGGAAQYLPPAGNGGRTSFKNGSYQFRRK